MAPSIREVLVIPNGSSSAQTVTTSGAVQAGDTFVVIQSTDNTTLTSATTTAGTLVQVGTDALDGNSTGVLRVLTCDATSGGSKNVTFPNQGGFDIYGIVIVMVGSVTVEGFAKSNVVSSNTTFTTPATTSLAGAADLLVSIGQMNQGPAVPWSLAGSGLTQQGQNTSGFGALYAGTAALTSAGVSPQYTVTTAASAKPAFVTIGLNGGTAPAAPAPRVVSQYGGFF